MSGTRENWKKQQTRKFNEKPRESGKNELLDGRNETKIEDKLQKMHISRCYHWDSNYIVPYNFNFHTLWKFLASSVWKIRSNSSSLNLHRHLQNISSFFFLLLAVCLMRICMNKVIRFILSIDLLNSFIDIFSSMRF